MKEFTNKVVVVTGATSGIGTQTAIEFAKEGARVVLIGRNAVKGHSIIENIKSIGGTAEFYQCDVSVEEEVHQLALYIEEKYDLVDVLFNNAGVMLPSAEIEKMSIDDWKKSFDINVDGVFFVTKYLKKMIFSSKGIIINNASIAGMQSYVVGRSYAYSASKAAIIQFSRQMAKNYAEEGVRVNCICPGIIDTPILGDRDRKIYAERIPLGYVGKPENVAKVVLFLASDAASYLTGVVLPIDGGVSI